MTPEEYRLQFAHLDARTGAHFSPCRTWRYLLWRTWNTETPPCMFIGLNPSTADERKDDPTIRRCIRFARDWGHGGLVMANVFPYRSTSTQGLLDPANPRRIGEHARGPRLANLSSIAFAAKSCAMIVAAWGAFPHAWGEAEEIADYIERELYCLDFTKEGQPRHPLYIAAETKPRLYKKPTRVELSAEAANHNVGL